MLSMRRVAGGSKSLLLLSQFHGRGPLMTCQSAVSTSLDTPRQPTSGETLRLESRPARTSSLYQTQDSEETLRTSTRNGEGTCIHFQNSETVPNSPDFIAAAMLFRWALWCVSFAAACIYQPLTEQDLNFPTALAANCTILNVSALQSLST